jgi:hypothetical protein
VPTVVRDVPVRDLPSIHSAGVQALPSSRTPPICVLRV